MEETKNLDFVETDLSDVNSKNSSSARWGCTIMFGGCSGKPPDKRYSDWGCFLAGGCHELTA